MDHQEDYSVIKKTGKLHNVLPLWGNEATMNLNPLILANIQGSSYFKVHLFKLKTYHEVVDEIYYQVKHLEPWERGSRKTSGQTGMCGGVRGVGAGGIVSTAYCLLYKLYTLRLTRKQVNGLLNHTDSPYIRALGFMYIRYTQPPGDLYDWYEDYFLDEEEIDVKAGGGQVMTIGQMAHQFLVKLDWFSTLFPRIPVPIQKQIENKLQGYSRTNNYNFNQHNSGNVAAPNRQNTYSRGSAGDGDFHGEREVRNYSGEFKDRDRDLGDRRRRDERVYRDPREREYGGSYRDEHDRREERFERPSSSTTDRYENREEHKRKHKHKDRSRSRDKREKEHYRDATSSDRYKDRDYEKKYR